MTAFARAPYLLRSETLDERSGILRIENAQDLLSGVIDAQSDPKTPVDLASRVARVVDPVDDHINVNPTYLNAVRGSWNAVREHPGNSEALADLGTATAELINKISDAAQISYDPDIDADNFGDAVSFQLPKAMENVAQAAAIASGPPDRLTVADRIAIGRNMAQGEVGWDGAENDYNVGFGAATTDVTALARTHDASAAAFSALRTRLNAIAEHPSAENVAALPGEYRAFDSAASTFALALSRHVQDLIERRIERATGRIVVTCVWGIVALAIALLLVARISRGMLERERRSLQIEKDRASALEAELARQRAERALVLNEAQFRTIFDGSPLGIATLDRNGELLERNPALFAMLDEFELFDEDFDASTYAKLLEGELRPPQFERQIVTSDGSARWLDMTVFPIRITDGDSVAAIAMIADVTERKTLSEQLRYEAKHDALTGLRSRGAFLEDVTAILGAHGAKRTRGQAVMLIDLDRFKLVNDSLGHAAGDDVLITVARRLLDVVRPSDVLARLHGDEFALFVTTSGESELAAIADRAQHTLRVPIVIEGQPVIVDSSIGICVAQPDVPADELLRNADTAMYNAKRMGRGRYVFFSGSMQEASTKWMRLASDMLLALENDEFRVAYQPIVSLEDATIRGFEALLRWDHHELGPISPVDFIPVAEETGAIAQLGHFVLAEACRQVARWDWEYRKTHRVTMSVNLSAYQLQEYIVADVEQCIAEAGITGDRLILEITESALLESGPQVSGILARLRATGARLSLDDFGTGYSSLRYLQQFPFDQLKIDRSFVCGPDGDIASEPIVRMLLNLADTLGLRAIAEGIETADQNAHLVALGCRYGQGFLFSQARQPADIKLDRSLAGARYGDETSVAARLPRVN